MPLKRLQVELRDWYRDPPNGFIALPLDDDQFHLQLAFPGPLESPYQGGVFVVSAEIPENYPLRPPRVRFITRLFHFQVNNEGETRLPILIEWSPLYTLRWLALSLQHMLAAPMIDDPRVHMMPEIARLYHESRSEFERTARQWVLEYAQNPSPCVAKALARPTLVLTLHGSVQRNGGFKVSCMRASGEVASEISFGFNTCADLAFLCAVLSRKLGVMESQLRLCLPTGEGLFDRSARLASIFGASIVEPEPEAEGAYAVGIAIGNFDPTEWGGECMRLTEGDVIERLQKMGGWWFGRRVHPLSSVVLSEGWFPPSYVVLRDEKLCSWKVR